MTYYKRVMDYLFGISVDKKMPALYYFLNKSGFAPSIDTRHPESIIYAQMNVASTYVTMAFAVFAITYLNTVPMNAAEIVAWVTKATRYFGLFVFVLMTIYFKIKIHYNLPHGYNYLWRLVPDDISSCDNYMKEYYKKRISHCKWVSLFLVLLILMITMKGADGYYWRYTDTKRIVLQSSEKIGVGAGIAYILLFCLTTPLISVLNLGSWNVLFMRRK